MAEKERNEKSIVVADNQHTWRDKLENYAWKNLLSILWSLLLLIGGFLLFAYYFFDLRYFPLLDLSSSLAFIAAAGLSGLILLFGSLFLALGPALMWAFMISSGTLADYFSAQGDKNLACARNRKFFPLPMFVVTAFLFIFFLGLSDSTWSAYSAVIITLMLLPFQEAPRDNRTKSGQDYSRIVDEGISPMRIRLNLALALFFAAYCYFFQKSLNEGYCTSPKVIVVFVLMLALLAAAYLFLDAKRTCRATVMPLSENRIGEKQCEPLGLTGKYFLSIIMSFIPLFIPFYLALILIQKYGPAGEQQIIWWIVAGFGFLFANLFFVEGAPLDMQHLSDGQWKARAAGMTLIVIVLVSWSFLPSVVVRNLSFGAMENIVLTVKGGLCGQLTKKLPGEISWITGDKRHPSQAICELPPLCVLSRLGTEYYVETGQSCPQSNSPKQQSIRFSIPSADVVSWSKVNSAEKKPKPDCAAMHDHKDGRNKQ